MRNKHNVDFKAVGTAQTFKLNYEHYEKLRALHCAAAPLAPLAGDLFKRVGGGGEGAGGPSPKHGHEHALQRDVYRLLARYQALEGHGFQVREGTYHARVLFIPTDSMASVCFAGLMCEWFLSF